MSRTTTAPTADLTTTFGRLVEAYTSLERQLGRALEERCDITHGWFEVLLRLDRAEDGQVSMGSLAEQVALTTGGATRMVDRMIAAGYVERVPCPTDRRIVYVALTAAGRAKLAEAATIHAANLERVFSGFSDGELGVLDAMLDRLREARLAP